MTDHQPPSDDVYTALVALDDPVECARRITEMSRRRGNLPPRFARLRTQRLLQARTRDGRKVAWLALMVGLRPSGISRLTARAVAA